MAAHIKTLTAFYDLAVGPVSFDVLAFLIRARMAAEEAACNRLHVVIVPHESGIAGMFRDKTNLYDAAEMEWRLWNLVIPACHLIGANLTLATDWTQARVLKTPDAWPPDWDRQSLKNKQYLPRPILEAARAGRVVPRLHASKHAIKKVGEWYAKLGKVVTLTLRNTYEPSRNSDPASWSALENAIKARGFAVVKMVDTQEALANGSGFGELNLDLRMACYECAAMNIFGNGGTNALLWYSDAPFIVLDAAMPFGTWQKFWENRISLRIGEQLPWARADQRLVYEAASAENLIRAFDRWAAKA